MTVLDNRKIRSNNNNKDNSELSITEKTRKEEEEEKLLKQKLIDLLREARLPNYGEFDQKTEIIANRRITGKTQLKSADVSGVSSLDTIEKLQQIVAVELQAREELTKNSAVESKTYSSIKVEKGIDSIRPAGFASPDTITVSPNALSKVGATSQEIHFGALSEQADSLLQDPLVQENPELRGQLLNLKHRLDYLSEVQKREKEINKDSIANQADKKSFSTAA